MGEKLAYVGLPCDIEALQKARAYAGELSENWPGRVALSIGLFCRENWAYTCFRALVQDDYDLPLEEVTKFDIKKGKLLAFSGEEVRLEIPLEKAKPYVRIGCEVCFDFSAQLADLSVGAVGSPMGWSTVIVRTPRGKAVMEGAEKAGYVEVKPIEEVKPGTKLIKRIDGDKKAGAFAESERREANGIQVLHLQTFGSEDLEGIKEAAAKKDFEDLTFDVIDPGLCSVCGNCSAACEEGVIEIIDERPQRVGECEEDCHLCYLFCPRASLPLAALEKQVFPNGTSSEDGIGRYLQILAVKALDEEIYRRRQDGGAVNALIAYALDHGVVDGAITTRKGEKPWEPVPALSRRREELVATGGTIYSHVTSIPTLRKATEKGREGTGK
jgi:coenzyme F420 hydrogenase subunit beta